MGGEEEYTMRKIFAVLLIAALAVTLVWFGCGKEPAGVTAPTTEPGPAAKLSGIPPGIERAMAVQDRHTDRVMGIRGVVGTATGLDADGNPVIKVFAMQPGVIGIPKSLDGVPVAIEVTGMFVARTDPKARFARPVPIGVSTGHPDITAGTIGCRVKDTSGNVYALSNNHVYANSNKATIGDNVLQPGPYDGGQDPEDAIGTLADFEPILFNGPNNTMDAAIARSTIGEVGYATPSDGGYGTPDITPVVADIGQPVQKCGRTTGQTQGQVSELNVTVDVCYKMAGPFRCKEWARFVDQIAITPGSFSDGGDSGSLIVTDEGNNSPVGLLFAGSDTRTIANPIGPVLNRFNVTIDDGSGQGNIPPTADFSYTTSNLAVNFTDKSIDPDGSVVTWAWDFGDGNTSAEQSPTNAYATSGTYTVMLTVTDNEGATGSKSSDVTVTEQGSAPVVQACDPVSGGLGQKLTVAVTGSNFQDGATVSFGERITVQEVIFVGSGLLDVKIRIHPRAASGFRDVTVTNPDGQSGTLPDGFTVN
jgi:hypothetical protein